MTSRSSPSDLAFAAPCRADTLPPLNELRGSRRLRFARDARDLEACLRLRYEVFNVELGEGLAESEALGLDRDRFDDVCDHLMVVDEPSGAVIGTYRLQTCAMARAGHGFYSAGEYDLGLVPPEWLSRTVELGRAAIARAHRDMSVLFLLWRGILAYQRWNGLRFLFGCSSITSQDPREGLDAYDWFARAGHLHPRFEVPALPGFVCEAAQHRPAPGEYAVPKLFGFYLRYGAKICSRPALDRAFGTIDFLTWTDTEEIGGGILELCTQDLPQRA